MTTSRVWPWTLLVCFAIGLGSRVAAQDTLVTAPAFYAADPATGDKPPQIKKPLQVSWPDELIKSDQPSYVLATLSIDSTGKKVVWKLSVPNEYFDHVVSWALTGAQFTPGTRGGQPIDTVGWMAVIFNPRSAKEGARETSPRLLAVGPVIVTRKELQGDGPATVWTILHVTETGAISISKFEDPLHERYRAKVEEALPLWRFAPAKKGEVALAADVRVPIQVQSMPKFQSAGKMVHPKTLKQERPIYPMSQRRAGMKGEVVILFDVDPQGHVVNPVVQRSTNPAFDEPAIEAILKWKFEPGTLDGKPVSVKMLQSIQFALSKDLRGGSDLFQVEQNKKALANLPDELAYDVPPKPNGVLLPVYPYSLLKDKISGRAKVRFVIDDHGHVSKVVVREATQPEFGLAMVAAVEAFSFIPALKNGKAVMSLLSMETKFDSNGYDGPPSREDLDCLRQEKKHPESIVVKGFDQPLKPISQKSPIFPSMVAAEVTKGSALVEILIDTDGHARLPRVISATDPAFGYAAVQAAADWRFEARKIKGEATLTRVQIPFSFSVKAANGPGNPPANAASPASENSSAPKAAPEKS